MKGGKAQSILLTLSCLNLLGKGDETTSRKMQGWVTIYRVKDSNEFKKVDMAKIGEGLQEFTQDTDLGKEINSLYSKLQKRIEKMAELPSDISQTLIENVNFPIALTSSRRKRSIPSILASNEKGFFKTDRKTICLNEDKTRFRLRSKCYKAFLEKIKEPRITNAGTQILNALLKYFQENDLEQRNTEFSDLLGLENKTHSFLVNRLEIELDDRNWFPTSDEPAAVSDELKLINELRDNLVSHRTTIAQNGKAMEKMRQKNEKRDKKVKSIKAITFHKTLKDILKMLLAVQDFRILNQKRYVKKNVFKEGANIVFEVAGLEKVGKAKKLVPYELCGTTCCIDTAQNSYLQLIQTKEFYNVKSCVPLHGIVICPENEKLDKMKCPILKKSCFQNNEQLVDIEKRLQYLSKQTAVFHPDNSVPLGPVTLNFPEIYLIESKQETQVDLGGIKLALQASPTLQYSFNVHRIPFTRKDIEEICKKKVSSFLEKNLQIMNMIGILFLSLVIITMVTCIAYFRKRTQKEQKKVSKSILKKRKPSKNIDFHGENIELNSLD